MQKLLLLATLLLFAAAVLSSPAGSAIKRKLQTPGFPQVVVNYPQETAADDPITENLEDALQPVNDFFNYHKETNTAIRGAIDQQLKQKLAPLIDFFADWGAVQRDFLYGGTDAMFRAKMDTINALGGNYDMLTYNASQIPSMYQAYVPRVAPGVRAINQAASNPVTPQLADEYNSYLQNGPMQLPAVWKNTDAYEPIKNV
eukprot:GDKI01049528.1.p2 GENE.GDKI01049528.1~~GDKI01049528.1.p2  ORF type:complete len:201 (-),score=58.08 GDKI01049528.1:27-629(-)